MYADKKAYQATLNDAEKAYFDARTTLNGYEDELRRYGRQRQDAQVKVNQLKEGHTELKFKLNAVSERLQIEFDLTLDQLSEVEVEEWNGTVAELCDHRSRGRTR